MRGGPFSETRVIELLNRRFVPFFYNTGGPGQGHDRAATDFARAKVGNQWAFLAAFAPDGEVLGVTEIYDGTREVDGFLRALLRRYPQYDRDTEAERATLAAGVEGGGAAVAAGRLAEQLGRHDLAVGLFERARGDTDAAIAAAAHAGRLRALRSLGDWPRHEQALADARGATAAGTLAVDLDLEQAQRWMRQRQFARVRTLLQPRTRQGLGSPRLAELHYEAGRACWFQGDRDMAKAHWCWILEHLPDDRLFQRARLAAGADAFPYPNQELAGFEAKTGPVGPGALDAGVAAAREVHARLWPRMAQGDFTPTIDGPADVEPIELTAEPALDEGVLDKPESLVARLTSGGEPATIATTMAKVRQCGSDAVLPLVVAGRNPVFAARARVATLLGEILTAHPILADEPRTWALDTLRDLAQVRTPAIAEAAKSALAAIDSAGK